MRPLLLLLLVPLISAYIKQSSEEPWLSLSEETSFQPSASQDERLVRARERFLWDTTTSSSANTQYPVDSFETEWDGYQQAWRMIGFYVDCSSSSSSNNQQNNNQQNSACQRYLLWAAYVDLDYQGGGIGEYQFWDRDAQSWDKTACSRSNGGRCAKMDCHLQDTHWQLLGYFKEASYSEEFFEQLFKHQGYCLWDEDEYEFMQEHYQWPEACQQTNTQVDGKYLYYDLKPIPGANMTIGLYTDSRCRYEYVDDEITAASVVQDMQVLQYIDKWNYGLEVYKTCQPCRAYLLHDNQQHRRRMEDANSGAFQCDDAAGYTNVNQCMKFRTKTTLEPAYYRDIMASKLQGSAVGIEFTSAPPQTFRTIAWVVFAVGALALLVAWFTPARDLVALREPFVETEERIAI